MSYASRDLIRTFATLPNTQLPNPDSDDDDDDGNGNDDDDNELDTGMSRLQLQPGSMRLLARVPSSNVLVAVVRSPPVTSPKFTPLVDPLCSGPSSASSWRTFSTTRPRCMPVQDRLKPLFDAFCEFLDENDVTGYTHRGAAYHDFVERSDPETQAHAANLRNLSDLIYRFRDQFQMTYPEFWALANRPPKNDPARLNTAPASTDHLVAEQFGNFLATYDWSRPTSKSKLRNDFATSLPPGPVRQRIETADSFWKYFDVRFGKPLSDTYPEYRHLAGLRTLHIVNKDGVVRRLTKEESHEIVKRELAVNAARFGGVMGALTPPGSVESTAEMTGEGVSPETLSEPAAEPRRRGRPRKMKVE